MRGKFVTIEGCDGSGKSTQIAMLGSALSALGIDYVFTREPGGTKISERIREIILDPQSGDMDDVTELLLYAAARRQHTVEFIARNLDAGRTVFCDRYVDSTLAYQGFGRGVDRSLIRRCNKIAVADEKIDLTLFLDLDPEEAFSRKGGADRNDRLESEDIAFYKRVYEGYKYIAMSEPERVKTIDSHGDPEAIHRRIMDALHSGGVI